MTSVLESTPPRFDRDDVARIAAKLFGLEGVATDLGSERDQTFLVEGPAGAGVVKLSNLGEDPGVECFHLRPLCVPPVAVARAGRPFWGVSGRDRRRRFP